MRGRGWRTGRPYPSSGWHCRAYKKGHGYYPPIYREYLLEEGGKVACEASGLINKKIVEVAVSDQSLGISKEVVIEVHGVNHGVEALAESVVVVLETNDSTEEEGFP